MQPRFFGVRRESRLRFHIRKERIPARSREGMESMTNHEIAECGEAYQIRFS